ncbi:MAG: substrate-binding domain-containing protein [Chloroflexota bacterium]
MNKQNRLERILTLIEESRPDQMVRTRELAQALNVSEITIRRDLNQLANEGAIVRTHGGVTSAMQNVGQTKPIGILLVLNYGKFSNPFFNKLLEGVDLELARLGYHAAFVKTDAEINSASEIELLLQQHPISALLVIGQLEVEKLTIWRAKIINIINVLYQVDSEVDAILIDSENGMYEMVKHLAQNGHRRIGFIMNKTGQRRLAGYLKGLEASQLEYDPQLIVALDSEGVARPAETGKEGAQHLLSLKKPPTAIMCLSDVIALGTMQWLQMQGISIPDDIAVTGFDDIEDAGLAYPPLTTVHVYKKLVGRLAVEQLHRRIQHPDDPPIRTYTPTSLVIRLSSGAS